MPFSPFYYSVKSVCGFPDYFLELLVDAMKAFTASRFQTMAGEYLDEKQIVIYRSMTRGNWKILFTAACVGPSVILLEIDFSKEFVREFPS